MTYLTTVLPDGRIDATPLPVLRPGTKVEITIPERDDSFEAFLKEMEEIGKDLPCDFDGIYTREVIYFDHD